MKKLTTLVAIPALLLAACGTTEDQQETDSTEETTESTEEATEESEEVTLDVASLIPPMTEILELVEPELAEEGIDLNVVVLGDNIQPNDALHHEEVDANFFQHVPFMEEYNINNDASLVPVEPIYFANYGVYAADYESMDELPEGATIAIANDISNIDRSLQLLAQHDVIELEETDERYYTQSHISENPNDYNFEEVDLLMLARMYDDADAVVITPAYAEPLGLTPANDALLTEGTENEFAITLVAREDNVDEEAIQTLAEVMTSDIVRDFLEENYDETAIPAFDHE
ncbi:MetQ/NlpA family ABC transporter substrate-binding protein [Geomicrobium sp. JCM 19038]|uniref:MetQ/NlpA family ABC transporter substrate-binding protein n=1 Tax=Geomicrobium sp. JCM 19038 TaxID=1460635 RepID=UPI00045F1D27|nr:MetQ/NlpA family ABC transporter substrate-binding protein [Geomicrobium sp. JCM 19038]GAK09208.1 methionine ABC transporter substrate-binding protein [Geomicrobium sp. JCM 19038]